MYHISNNKKKKKINFRLIFRFFSISYLLITITVNFVLNNALINKIITAFLIYLLHGSPWIWPANNKFAECISKDPKPCLEVSKNHTFHGRRSYFGSQNRFTNCKHTCIGISNVLLYKLQGKQIIFLREIDMETQQNQQKPYKYFRSNLIT